MFKSAQEEGIALENFDALYDLNDRLYCASMAAQCTAMDSDDPLLHHKIIASEIRSIWQELDRIIDSEVAIRAHLREEMDKFDQGFAYKRKGVCAGNG